VLFLSHGGGPLPLLHDPEHAELLLTYALIRQKLDALQPPPSALFVYQCTLGNGRANADRSGPDPPLLFDYYGFPPQSYSCAIGGWRAGAGQQTG